MRCKNNIRFRVTDETYVICVELPFCSLGVLGTLVFFKGFPFKHDPRKGKPGGPGAAKGVVLVAGGKLRFLAPPMTSLGRGGPQPGRLCLVLTGAGFKGSWRPSSEVRVGAAGTEWAVAKDQRVYFMISHRPATAIPSPGIHDACAEHAGEDCTPPFPGRAVPGLLLDSRGLLP